MTCGGHLMMPYFFTDVSENSQDYWEVRHMVHNFRREASLQSADILLLSPRAT